GIYGEVVDLITAQHADAQAGQKILLPCLAHDAALEIKAAQAAYCPVDLGGILTTHPCISYLNWPLTPPFNGDLSEDLWWEPDISAGEAKDKGKAKAKEKGRMAGGEMGGECEKWCGKHQRGHKHRRNEDDEEKKRSEEKGKGKEKCHHHEYTSRAIVQSKDEDIESPLSKRKASKPPVCLRSTACSPSPPCSSYIDSDGQEWARVSCEKCRQWRMFSPTSPFSPAHPQAAIPTADQEEDRILTRGPLPPTTGPLPLTPLLVDPAVTCLIEKLQFLDERVQLPAVPDQLEPSVQDDHPAGADGRAGAPPHSTHPHEPFGIEAFADATATTTTFIILVGPTAYLHTRLETTPIPSVDNDCGRGHAQCTASAHLSGKEMGEMGLGEGPMDLDPKANADSEADPGEDLPMKDEGGVTGGPAVDGEALEGAVTDSDEDQLEGDTPV
ncbi:hypothetical protein EW146_g8664, partial [Bondarzewia mesenterica]